MIKTLLGQVGEYKKDSILTPVFTAAEVFMEILIPFVTAKIIDDGINGQDMSKVYMYGGLMLVLAFLSLFFGVMAGKFAASASTGFACNLREGMYRNVQEFSFTNIDKFSTASLITRMTTDVTNVQNAYQMLIRIAVRAPLMLICSMIMCFTINVELSLVFVAALVVLAFGLFYIIFKVTPIFDEVFRNYDNLNASVQENVSAIRVVKAFVREEYEDKKFGKAAEVLAELSIKAESLLAFNNPIMMFVIFTCMMLLSWIGAHFIVGGSMTTGNLTSLFSYVMSMMMSLMMLSMVFVMISMSMASMRRISEVLEETPTMTNPDEPIMEVPDGRIDFNHVDFVYKAGSAEDTLKDIDIHIKSGETVGVIGGTGCGKSTFVNLISRLYDVKPDGGSVCVGGHDVRDYDMEVIRNEVAVVLQKNVLFSGTILDNLRWGKEDATEEECREVCALACADEFIDSMPDGYNTWIEQGGSNVSGGQKQRLAIARAVARNAKIYIFDDSFSALDFKTDVAVRKALREDMTDSTVFIVAQRVSTILHADQILVLDEGKIVGKGTHKELMENCPVYEQIARSQLSEKEIAASIA
mgnify:CR=1 FL=1